MKTNIYRTIAIWAVVIFTAINIYPTFGWLSLSEQEQADRLAKWKEEDSVFQRRDFWRDTKKSIVRWAQFDRDKVVNLGLDLQGGVHIVLEFEVPQELKDKGVSDQYMQEMVLRKIQRRVNEFEAKEPVIQTMGSRQIVIQLPGEKDVDRATSLITKTAFLTFNIAAGPEETIGVVREIGKHTRFQKRFTPFLLAPTARQGQFRIPVEHVDKIKTVIDEINANPEKLLPEGKILALSQPPDPGETQEYELYLIDAKPLMSGEGLTRAIPQPDTTNPGKYEIAFSFNATGARDLAKVTEANVNKQMGIVLDGVVISAPTIQEKIGGGQGRITGNFNNDEALDLSIALNSGSMPVPVQIAYKGVVGPSLGRDSINSGLMASVWGLVLVIFFMGLYYRFGGLVANVALFLNGFILLATFSYFGLTLTLPGIAGFVLTLGMAVDANVLLFERIREEVRNGKSLIASIELGYERAAVTIIDSNVTTLIAAVIMLQFGTGPVQGFGIALALGILTSVFTALVVTKAIFDLMNRRKWLKRLSMMDIIPETKIPFIEWRNIALIASGVLLLIGVGAMAVRGSNVYGVDFAGGTSMVASINTEQKVDTGQVRAALEGAGFSNTIVQEYEETAGGAAGNAFAIRTSDVAKIDAAQGNDIESRVRQALAPLAGAGAEPSVVALDKVESVGAAISRSLQLDAMWAIMASLIFIIAYVWFRYNLVFAITGVIALFHDSLFALGAVAVTGRHIDMNVVAAVLTIIGYSINDTVVIYDRIREDLRLYAGRGMSLMEIMNRAINQTLSRTIFTSFVTMLSVLTIFIFGGPVLNDFAFALLAGMVAGVYSTVFIATSLAYLIQMYWRKREAANVSKNTPSSRRRRESKSNESPA